MHVYPVPMNEPKQRPVRPRYGSTRSVYLSDAQAARVDELEQAGVKLADIVRAGLDAVAGEQVSAAGVAAATRHAAELAARLAEKGG